jgi:hypothetical protein
MDYFYLAQVQIFGDVIKCTHRRHKLSPILTIFYKNNCNPYYAPILLFGEIKRRITNYIKYSDLMMRHKISFEIDKELSCFGLVEGTVIQNYDMDTFISHVITYLPNDDNNIVDNGENNDDGDDNDSGNDSNDNDDNNNDDNYDNDGINSNDKSINVKQKK